MVEETIRTIRETEKKADEIVKEAQEQAVIILENAKKEAEKLSGKMLEKVRFEADQVLLEAKRSGEQREAEAARKTDSEIKSLKGSAAEREDEAVDLVISLLA